MITKISNELRIKILDEIEKYKFKLMDLKPRINSESKYVYIPILIEGVVDRIRFDTIKKRYDQIEIFVKKFEMDDIHVVKIPLNL